jgi:hypothetical protein
MNGWEITEWAVAIAAFITACGIIWRQVLRPIGETLSRIESSLQYVEGELKLNGGSTARDAIARVETALTLADQRMTRLERHLDLRPLDGD